MGVLKGSKYKPVGEPVLLNGGRCDKRVVSFGIGEGRDLEEIVDRLGEMSGVLRCHKTEEQEKVRVEYNPSVVKGW